jgi:hypothetical protein
VLTNVRTLMNGGAVGGVTLASKVTLGTELSAKLVSLAPSVLTSGRLPLASEVTDRVTPVTPVPCTRTPTGATGATGATGVAFARRPGGRAPAGRCRRGAPGAARSRRAACAAG